MTLQYITMDYHENLIGLKRANYILNHTSNAKSNRSFNITYIVSSIVTQFYQKLKH